MRHSHAQGAAFHTALQSELDTITRSLMVGPRTALVIGNSAYAESKRLPNARKGAEALIEKLEKLKFDVTAGLDADLATMKKRIEEFHTKVERMRGLSFFYFAGHSFQSSVHGNDLVLYPTDVDLRFWGTEESMTRTDVAVRLSQVAGVLTGSSGVGSVNILVLDSCRTELSRGLTRGEEASHQRIQEPDGSLLVWSTLPGEAAQDDGPFTKYLLQHLDIPGMHIKDMFDSISREMRSYVVAPNAHRQRMQRIDQQTRLDLKVVLLPEGPLYQCPVDYFSLPGVDLPPSLCFDIFRADIAARAAYQKNLKAFMREEALAFATQLDANVERIPLPSNSSFVRWRTHGRVTVVAFPGTEFSKSADIYTNAQLWGDTADLDGLTGRVHSGFWKRANEVELDSLISGLEFLENSNERLVITGHSLGGAVAQLVTLRLLEKYRAQYIDLSKRVLCITFGQPLVGDRELSEYVEQRLWQSSFISLINKRDLIPRLLLFKDKYLRYITKTLSESSFVRYLGTEAVRWLREKFTPWYADLTLEVGSGLFNWYVEQKDVKYHPLGYYFVLSPGEESNTEQPVLFLVRKHYYHYVKGLGSDVGANELLRSLQQHAIAAYRGYLAHLRWLKSGKKEPWPANLDAFGLPNITKVFLEHTPEVEASSGAEAEETSSSGEASDQGSSPGQSVPPRPPPPLLLGTPQPRHRTPQQKLMAYVASDNKAALLSLLESSALLMGNRALGFRLLRQAVLLNKPLMVDALVNIGFNINAKPHKAVQLLQNSVEGGLLNRIELLFASGLPKSAILVSNLDGRHSLSRACEEGDMAIVSQLLLPLTADDVNTADADGQTCLQRAAAGEHAEVVRAALRVGAQAHTALEVALESGNENLVLGLIAALAQNTTELALLMPASSPGESYISLAVTLGSSKVLEALLPLLGCGQATRPTCLPVSYAIQERKFDLLMLLIEHKCSLVCEDGEDVTSDALEMLLVATTRDQAVSTRVLHDYVELLTQLHEQATRLFVSDHHVSLAEQLREQIAREAETGSFIGSVRFAERTVADMEEVVELITNRCLRLKDERQQQQQQLIKAFDLYIGLAPEKKDRKAAAALIVALRHASLTAAAWCAVEGWGEVTRNKDTARALLMQAATGGDAMAQLLLGRAYYGVVEPAWDVNKDAAAAVKWYRRAAEQGHSTAQYNLGVMYYFGEGGLDKDAAAAVKWWKRAAEQGDSGAQYNLGLMYYYGEGGLDKDAAAAVKWYRRAAEQGHSTAQFNLGVMYYYGEGGLDKDAAAAVKWYKRAAEQGHSDAQFNLGLMYSKGEGGLDKDAAAAVKWYKRAAEQGDSSAVATLERIEAGI